MTIVNGVSKMIKNMSLVGLLIFALSFMRWAEAETLTIDLRTFSEPYLYMLSFAAISSTYNHAFVIFTNEDEITQATVQAYFGFYATGSISESVPVAIYQAFISGVDGSVQPEALEVIQTPPVHVLNVFVNSDTFDSARQKLEAWRTTHPTYRLLIKDCVTFTSDIAETIGLKTPTRIIYPDPQDYILELIQENKP
jgi:hypothetical protein